MERNGEDTGKEVLGPWTDREGRSRTRTVGRRLTMAH